MIFPMLDPDALPPTQILALLRLHGGAIAAILAKEMTESGFAKPSPEDVYALSLSGYVASRNGRVYLTPAGRQTAEKMIRKFGPHSALSGG
jgi:hypothetical protein